MFEIGEMFRCVRDAGAQLASQTISSSPYDALLSVQLPLSSCFPLFPHLAGQLHIGRPSGDVAVAVASWRRGLPKRKCPDWNACAWTSQLASTTRVFSLYSSAS